MVGHLVFHSSVGVLAFENEALTESSIEAAMGFRGEPDEVGGSVIGVVAV